MKHIRAVIALLSFWIMSSLFFVFVVTEENESFNPFNHPWVLVFTGSYWVLYTLREKLFG